MNENPFIGGGAMGELMRALDWSKTAVGPTARWPSSLRTALDILLSSGYPTYIAWGKDFTQFYNDAYRPILGSVKHPSALGRSTRETFAEIWEFIGPMFERVLSTGTASTYIDQLLPMDRHGFIEECYFTFSYSAIREADRVGGVFVSVLETTERMLRERRERTTGEISTVAARGSLAEICQAFVEKLKANPHDIPFCLFVQNDEPGTLLAGTNGDSVRLHEILTASALRRDGLLSTSEMAGIDLIEPLVLPPWPQPVTRAAVVPVTPIGHTEPLLHLIVGLSGRLLFDAPYQNFLRSIANGAAGVLSEAEAFEAERRRAEALAELDRAKTTFFSNVSHEFRTPLTLMLSPLDELLTRGEALPAPIRETITVVHRNALRLLKLVNTLLDFARIEAGRIQANYEPIDLSAFTAELASVFRSAIEKAGLRFVVACEPLPEPVYVDREMWEKIIFNFLSNAFKFTFHGEIAVTLSARAGQAELSVRDTGVGIPEAELPQIFKRFHRVQGTRSRTHEGTGIGLALIKELVSLHGGRVAVESRVDHGTRFVITIPFGCDHLPADRIGVAPTLSSTALRADAVVDETLRWLPANTEATAPHPTEEPSAYERAHILLVDDNADMRDYVQRLLSARWRVEVAGDGVQALAAIRRRPPDLLLTDVMMPNLDGFGLLRAVRNDPKLKYLPVVMVSARAGEESRIDGLHVGADDYLVKPFSARELMVRVEGQLVRARTRRIEMMLNQRLADVFRHAPVGLALLRGKDHVFEFVNDEYSRLVHRRPLLGHTIRQAFPELENQGFFDLLDRAYATGEPFTGRSMKVLLRDEAKAELEERFFDFVYQPMPDEEGKILGIAVIVFEVTDIARARHKAELASRAKDEFLAMLGHELRNPLSPILTAVHLMNLRGDPTSITEREIIERQVRYMVRLVDDLLDVARVTRGELALKNEIIDLATVVNMAVETTSPLLEQRQHTLTVDVPEGAFLIEGDNLRLAQIVSNLLTNAARYTDPGGRIAVSAGFQDGNIALEVRDNGIGIAAEALPRIFDMFVQGERQKNRQHGGLGLGLTIASKLAVLHGGRLSAHSAGPGRGSTFVLHLPAVASATLNPAQPRDAAPTPVADASAGHRILIVDDNADAAQMLSAVLERCGHTTRTTHDGPSTLMLLERFNPELALLDIGLPVMDGHELGRRIRRSFPHVKLIALTGYGQSIDRQRSLEAGFDAHVVKPIDVQVIETLIRSLLRRSGAYPRRSSAVATEAETRDTQ